MHISQQIHFNYLAVNYYNYFNSSKLVNAVFAIIFFKIFNTKFLRCLIFWKITFTDALFS